MNFNERIEMIKTELKTKDLQKALEKVFSLINDFIIAETCGIIIRKKAGDEIYYLKSGEMKLNSNYKEIPDEIKHLAEVLFDDKNQDAIEDNKAKYSHIGIKKIIINDNNCMVIWVEKDKEASYLLDDELELLNEVSLSIKLYLEQDMLSKKEIEDENNDSSLLLSSRFDNLITASSATQEVINRAIHFANYDVPILIIGETGTGKEEIAKLIHNRSNRANKPFVVVNCGAIPETLFESEIFGHKRGAFTNAYSDRIGLLKEAENGTIFFDEIADLSLINQVKLLRVIENREFRRVGENTVEAVKARFIFATNKNVEEMVKAKTFRDDLFYRINTATILIPPLRVRKEDCLIMFRHFVNKYAEEYKIGMLKIDDAFINFIKNYPWPGNVRELISLAKQLVLWHKEEGIISEKDLPDWIKRSFNKVINFPASLHEARDNFTKDYILKVLKICNYNKSQACKILKLSRWGLHKLMMRLNIYSKKCFPKEKEDSFSMGAVL